MSAPHDPRNKRPPDPDSLDLSQFLEEDPEPLSASFLSPVEEDPQALSASALEALGSEDLQVLDAGALEPLAEEAGTDPGVSALEPLPDYSAFEVMEGLEATSLGDDPAPRPRRPTQEPPARRRGPEPFEHRACPSCATELPSPAPAFCEACGMRLVKPGKKGGAADETKRCGECGVRSSAEAERCKNCGSRL